MLDVARSAAPSPKVAGREIRKDKEKGKAVEMDEAIFDGATSRDELYSPSKRRKIMVSTSSSTSCDLEGTRKSRDASGTSSLLQAPVPLSNVEEPSAHPEMTQGRPCLRYGSEGSFESIEMSNQGGEVLYNSQRFQGRTYIEFVSESHGGDEAVRGGRLVNQLDGIARVEVEIR